MSMIPLNQNVMQDIQNPPKVGTNQMPADDMQLKMTIMKWF